MGNVQSLSHSKWECIYHITWIPKYKLWSRIKFLHPLTPLASSLRSNWLCLMPAKSVRPIINKNVANNVPKILPGDQK